ncbi:putative rlpA-like protein, double-psi beta-barrel [Helianthus annuus]|uniref:Putative rlpA-like double-psi beta-barrel domain-containing protein n=1 Tax=Helianthus annuus TaxID=4232 RepID=A0A251V8R7_HELAN|nr:putative rlpA-like protein, double-psi beta-barrel [Helianthus annuus]KAJ0600764.1 putative rlpA-like protein, double-psi beta-barrel [Helianthus annuus]KAJ0768086.1 putative EG45-like domain containing protein, plant [Helianthus annuus]KAJ0773864.1 putative EG45-like domain containing protein, plant [Helianthus annuus]
MINYIVITASACYGFQDQGVMIAAANQDLWQGGAACGKYFQVTCTGATNQGVPHPCTDTPTVTVMITDFCPPPGCKGNLDLSHEAFSTIADPRAGGIKISYEEYVINYLFFNSFLF